MLALIQQDKNCNVFPMSIYHQMIKYHERMRFGDYQFEVSELPAESDEEKKLFIDPSAISIVTFNNSLPLDHRYLCDILLDKMTEQRHQRWMTIVECYLAECIQRQSNHNVMEKDYVCDPINAMDALVSAITIYHKQLKANDSHRYLTDLNAFFNIPQEAEDVRKYIERYVFSIDVSRQSQNIEPAAQASKNLSSVTRLEK